MVKLSDGAAQLSGDAVCCHIQKNSQEKKIYNKLNKNIKDFKFLGLDINTYEDYTNSKNYNNFKNWEQIEKLLK